MVMRRELDKERQQGYLYADLQVINDGEFTCRAIPSLGQRIPCKLRQQRKHHSRKQRDVYRMKQQQSPYIAPFLSANQHKCYG